MTVAGGTTARTATAGRMPGGGGGGGTRGGPATRGVAPARRARWLAGRPGGGTFNLSAPSPGDGARWDGGGGDR